MKNKKIIFSALILVFSLNLLSAETAGGQSGRLNYVSLESFFVNDFLIGARYARDLFRDVPVQAGASFYVRPFKKTFNYPATSEVKTIFEENNLDVQVREKRVMFMFEASTTPFFTERFGLNLGCAWVLTQGWSDGISLYDNFTSAVSANAGILIGLNDNLFLGTSYRFIWPYLPGNHYASLTIMGVF